MPRAASILAELELFGVKLGLERIRALLVELGSPQAGMPVVLVAGTNGKGSTATVLASIAGAAGYRTGLYTSPHLETVEERIRVGGRSIGEGRLGELLSRVVGEGERSVGTPPTYFEALTAAALLHFRDQKVDLAVLEVGLGGRLDATNACEPSLSLITSISLDHQWVLGDDLAAIAGEKAGILRPDTPALTWIEASEARLAVEERARALGARCLDARGMASWSGGPGDWTLRTLSRSYRLEPRLAGEHQRANVALAVLAAEHLGGAGFPGLRAATPAGVAAARWPGRLERIDLDGGRWVLLDGAHNGDSARCLRRYLDGLAEVDVLVFGALRDKPAAAMLADLCPRARRTLLVRPDSDRAIDPASLLEALPTGHSGVVCAGVGEAMGAALAEPGSRVVVCGSLYLVGEARVWLRRRFGRPSAAAASRVGY